MKKPHIGERKLLLIILLTALLMIFLSACFKLGGELSIDAEFTLIREEVPFFGISEYVFSVDVKGVKDAAVVEFDNGMPSVTLNGGKAESRFFANIGTEEVTLVVRDSWGVELLKKTVVLEKTVSQFREAALGVRTGLYLFDDPDLVFYSVPCLAGLTLWEKSDLLDAIDEGFGAYIVVDIPGFVRIHDFDKYPYDDMPLTEGTLDTLGLPHFAKAFGRDDLVSVLSGKNLYSLTVNWNAGGHVSVNPDCELYEEGTEVTLTAIPEEGKAFVGWSGDVESSSSELLILMNTNFALLASFSEEAYTIAFTVADQDGPIEIASVELDGEVRQTDSNGGAVFADVTAGEKPYTVRKDGYESSTGRVNVDADKNVNVFLEKKTYTLATTVIGQGSVVRDPDREKYTHGEVVKLTAVPSTGWNFNCWSGDYEGSEDTIDLLLDSDKNVIAGFSEKRYFVEAIAEPLEGGLVTGGGSYGHGEEAVLVAEANDCYMFSGWYEDGLLVSETSEYRFQVTDERRLEARFEMGILMKDFRFVADIFIFGSQYEVNLLVNNKITRVEFRYPEDSGVPPVPGEAFPDENGEVYLSAFLTNPAATSILIVCYAGENTVSICEAQLSKENLAEFDLTFNVIDEEGSVFGASIVFNGEARETDALGKAFFACVTAGTKAYTVSKTGYENVTGNVNVDSDKSVNVVLEKKTYTLSTNTAGQGSVSKNPDKSIYTHGETVQLTAIPSTGWSFSSWSGYVSGSDNPVTVTVEGNGTVTATFDPLPFDITFSVKDIEGSPLQGATVLFNGQTKNTASCGCATFSSVLAGEKTYSVSKTGYNTFSGSVVVDSDKTVNVVLNVASDDEVDLDGPVYSGNRLLVSNESTSENTTQYTGTLPSFADLSIDNVSGLEIEAYRMNPLLDFDPGDLNHLDIQPDYELSAIGDTRQFWVFNFVTQRDYQITATLQAIGNKALVWAEDTMTINASRAQQIAAEFDSVMYSLVVENFYSPSDVNGDGKIAILCFDIVDGFTGSGGYYAGYFWSKDLYPRNDINPYSNEMEIFYIDTYPLMEYPRGSPVAVTRSYSTIVHEFQHMVNHNRNVFVESGSSMKVWLNEGLSMAAEHIYEGVQTGRISFFNNSTAIRDGKSLIRWEQTLADYSLNYLFLQYIRTQMGIGSSIFKEILLDTANDYRAVENVVKKYISPSKSFGDFMTDFRIALLLKEPTGPYGFMGESCFNSVSPLLYTGTGKNLYGGGALYKSIVGAFEDPGDTGASIQYAGITLE